MMPHHDVAACARIAVVASMIFGVAAASVAEGVTEGTPVETLLPARPLENSRVIIAPCSPVMARQQQWSFPTAGADAPLQLLLSSDSNNDNDNDGNKMYLVLEQSPTEAGLLGVVRSFPSPSPSSASASAPPSAIWTFNATLDVLQLANTTIASAKCLTTFQNGQYAVAGRSLP